MSVEAKGYFQDSLTQYLNEIGEYTLLTKEKEFELGTMVQSGLAAQQSLQEQLVNGDTIDDDLKEKYGEIIDDGLRAREEFICANLRLVVSVAKRYQSAVPNATLLDVIQYGNEGLEHAVGKFDPDRGYKFSTYATWWIRQAITKRAGEERVIKVPHSTFDDAMTVRKFSLEGYSDEEIAETRHLELSRVHELLGFSRTNVVSSDDPVSGPSGEGDATFLDFIPDEHEDTEQEGLSRAFSPETIANELSDLIGSQAVSALVLRSGAADGIEYPLNVVTELIGQKSSNATRYIIRKAQTQLAHPSLHFKVSRLFPGYTSDDSWKEKANCSESELSVFVDTSNKASSKDEDQAIKICADCPIQQDCEELGVEIKAKFGIWGGKRRIARRK